MIDRRIKFRHIQCLVEIAREGSFKAAAHKLSQTQPAISKTIKELEEIVGASLMIRSRAGVDLTHAGKVFMHFAQMSLASLQQGLDGVEQATQSEGEILIIGALPSVAARLMPGFAVEFSARAPQARLRIVDGPHGYLVERLRLGELDMVIGRLGRPETMHGITFTQLYNEKVVFVVRPGHPLLAAPSLAAISDWQVIFPSEGSAIRPLVERFLISNGIGSLPNQLDSVSGAFGRIHTQNSDAIWIISGGVVAGDIARGDLIRLPFDTEITQGPVGLMRRPDTLDRPIDLVFEQSMKATLEKLAEA